MATETRRAGRRALTALLLAVLMLLTGCVSSGEIAKSFSALEEAELLDPAYRIAPPPGIQPTEERRSAENHIEAPEKKSIVQTGYVTYVANEILLVMNRGASKARVAEIAEKYGFTAVGFIEAASTAQLRARSDHSLGEIEALCTRMEAEPDVMRAGAHYLRKTVSQTLPDDGWQGDPLEIDTAAGCNWGMEAIRATWVWENFPELDTQRIGIIDTMFDVNHDDVTFAQLLHNDIYYDTDKNTADASHGTFVAGIIGAGHNNKLGTAGVLKNCELVGSSLYGAQEESSCLAELSLLAELLSYNIRIVNYSLGYTADTVAALDSSDASALAAYESEVGICTGALSNILRSGYDFILVCAAGNSGRDARFTGALNGISDPEVREHILVVGAAELTAANTYALAPYSSTGPRVDVLAPGSGVYSDANRHGYTVTEGTSVAAPHAAGACGVFSAMYPEFSCKVIKQFVVESADIKVAGTDIRMIDLKTGMDAYYNGNGKAPQYVYSPSDPVDFNLFLCAENEKLDSGSRKYYFHRIIRITTLGQLLKEGFSPDQYFALIPLDGHGTPLRTDVVQILEYQKMDIRDVCHIRYKVLCSGDVVYDKVSEIRESVIAPDTWVWVLREEIADFGSDVLSFDLDHDGITETDIPIVELRQFFNRQGDGSVRLVGCFNTAKLYPYGVTSWDMSNPSRMILLHEIKCAPGNDAYELWLANE